MFVHAHDLFDGVQIRRNALGVDDTRVFLHYYAVGARHAHKWDKLAKYVVQDYFLVALMMEKMSLYLLEGHADAELFLKVFADLTAKLVDVHFVHLFRHKVHDLVELDVFTSIKLTEWALGRLSVVLRFTRAFDIVF